jgi:hypothetical protein
VAGEDDESEKEKVNESQTLLSQLISSRYF